MCPVILAPPEPAPEREPGQFTSRSCSGYGWETACLAGSSCPGRCGPPSRRRVRAPEELPCRNAPPPRSSALAQERASRSSTSASATCRVSCSTSRSRCTSSSEDAFDEGYGFDGSSIRGFQEIQESDMILMPDPNTAVIDPFRQHPTLNINCFVRDPVTGEPYSRDPRYVAKKAEDYLASTGIADTAYFGPEAEFFIFDDVRFSQDQRSAFYQVDSIEGIVEHGPGRGPEPGLQAPVQGGLLPGPAHGPLPGPALGDDRVAGAGGHRDRGPAPRGGHRRPGRDRHALRLAAGAWPTS